jgi:hypothetical protein
MPPIKKEATMPRFMDFHEDLKAEAGEQQGGDGPRLGEPADGDLQPPRQQMEVLAAYGALVVAGR